jgi:hypothetical protein
VAQYDSADLLARTRRALRLPALDQPEVDASLYQALEEAQTHWMGRLAALVPESNYTIEKLTTPDGGLTYTLAAEPMGGHLELRAARDGVMLIPSTDWGSGDFVMEGQVIRIPGNRTRTFADGPWARYVKAPGLLDATNPPIIKPSHIRLLLVQRAAAIYARNSEGRNPQPYLDEENRLWQGDRRLGEVGFLDQLKTQYFAAGAQSVVNDGSPWYTPFLGR